MENLDQQWQTTKDLITKFRLNLNIFAELLSMKQPVFSEKYNEVRYNSLKPDQKAKITKYLLGMGKVLVCSLGK